MKIILLQKIYNNFKILFDNLKIKTLVEWLNLGSNSFSIAVVFYCFQIQILNVYTSM